MNADDFAYPLEPEACACGCTRFERVGDTTRYTASYRCVSCLTVYAVVRLDDLRSESPAAKARLLTWLHTPIDEVQP